MQLDKGTFYYYFQQTAQKTIEKKKLRKKRQKTKERKTIHADLDFHMHWLCRMKHRQQVTVNYNSVHS